MRCTVSVTLHRTLPTRTGLLASSVRPSGLAPGGYLSGGEEGVYEAGTERAGGRRRYFYLSSDVRDAEFADDDGGRS